MLTTAVMGASDSQPVEQVAAALETEEALLDVLVAPLDAAGWHRSTPAPGWRVHDQIGHLAVSEEWATDAVLEPERFASMLEDVRADLAAFTAGVEARVRSRSHADVLAWWRDQRRATVIAVRSLPPGARIPWFGPPMGARAFLTARLMETWAHGQDVRDALGSAPSESERLRDIAHLGVVTRPFTFANRGRAIPEAPVRVELRSPGGETWTWGPPDAPDRIVGDAVDFCLVVTQRRNAADTALRVDGADAQEWMSIAQAFAGPATDPPPAGSSRPLR
jgi:uncharacterized protein (TIGR03084 family)